MKNTIKKIEKIFREATIKSLIVIFVTFFIVGVLFSLIYRQQPVKEFLFDRNIRYDLLVKAPMGNLNVEVANTGTERERGLSYRSSMNIDEGMIFVFDKSGKYGFWMKDMNFPLDLIWLDEEGRVVYEVNNVSPSTYPGAFINEASAKYVLEVNAGTAEKYGIYLGTKLNLEQTK